MNTNNKYKLELSHQLATELAKAIEVVITSTDATDDDDKLWISCLYELDLALKKRMVEPKKKYRFTLKPALAFALRILYTYYYQHSNISHLGNRLRMIADDIHKQFSKPN